MRLLSRLISYELKFELIILKFGESISKRLIAMEVQHSDRIFVGLKFQCFIEVLVIRGGHKVFYKFLLFKDVSLRNFN